MELDWQGWFTLAVVALSLTAMVREVAAPDLVMMAALFALAAVGVLTPQETFSGFANPALAAVGALFIVSAGRSHTSRRKNAAAPPRCSDRDHCHSSAATQTVAFSASSTTTAVLARYIGPGRVLL